MWAPNTMLSFRKNLWANSEKTYGQTEGRTDRRTDRPYFIGPFQTKAGGPIKKVFMHLTLPYKHACRQTGVEMK